jgi:hypothetical protein
MPARRRTLARYLGIAAPLLFAGFPAWAQMGPLPGLSPSTLNQPNGPAELDGSGSASALNVIAQGGSVARTLAAWAADRINVRNYGAKGDTLTRPAGLMTAGSPTLTASGASFTSADVGKAITVDGAGASPAAPLITTIAAYVSPTQVTLAANAGTSTGLSYLPGLSAGTSSTITGSYVPGDIVALAGGTAVTGASGKVMATTVLQAAIAAAGTGGYANGSPNGACSVTGTTGTGTRVVLTVTLSGGAMTAITAVTTPGVYTADIASHTSEPVVGSTTAAGCALLTGAAVALQTVPVDMAVQVAGAYSAVPPGNVAAGAGSLSGATGFNVTASWGVTGALTYGTDDSAAFAAAETAMMAKVAAGAWPCVYAPAGNYLFRGTAQPLMAGSGCILGDGALRTVFTIDAGYSGDLISMSNAWPGGNFPFNGRQLVATGGAVGGPRLRGFSILGDRAAPNAQNAISFYNRTQNLDMEDIEVRYVAGRALWFGATNSDTQAFLQESRIVRTRFFNDGAPGLPVVEFGATVPAGQEGTGEVRVDTMDIYAPYGTGVMIRNAAALVGGAGGTHLTEMWFNRLRIEGLENDAAQIGANLLQIGDPAYQGPINAVAFKDLELLDPYLGQYALLITGPASPAAGVPPSQLEFHGAIGGGMPLGGAVNITAGSAIALDFQSVYSVGTEITVGPASGGVASPIRVSSPDNQVSAWTWNIDSSVLPAVLSAPSVVGNPGAPGGLALVGNTHDSTAAGGNATGAGAVDLQFVRSGATQVAGGNQSGLFAGLNNSASAGASVVLGGAGNSVSGTYGAILGGLGASDRGRQASYAYASGSAVPFTTGSTQAGRQALYATGTAAMRLFAGGGLTANAFNIFNIPAGTAMALSIRLSAIDRTAPVNSYAWFLPIALATRQSAASSTAVAVGTPVALSTGTGASASVSLTADTANAGINLTFTPPGGTDTWDVFADVYSAEAQ